MELQNDFIFIASSEVEDFLLCSQEQYECPVIKQKLANKSEHAHDLSELNEVSYEDQINEAIDSKNIRKRLKITFLHS